MPARPLLLLSCAAILLSACGQAPDRAGEGDTRTLTIKTDDTPPPEPKAKGGKMAVLPDGVTPVAAEPPKPVEPSAAPVEASPGQPGLQPAAMPQAPEAYRPVRPEPSAEEPDPRLVDDCLAADREGHPFAQSRACRRALGH